MYSRFSEWVAKTLPYDEINIIFPRFGIGSGFGKRLFSTN